MSKLHTALLREGVSSSLSTLISLMGEILHVRKGSRLSRLFRLILQHKAINKIVGTNLAFAIFAAGVIPGNLETHPLVNLNTTTPVSFQTESAIRFPVDRMNISQGYWGYHRAIDIDGITGEPVYTIKPGKVIYVEYSNTGYGNHIIIKHGEEFSTLYAHLSVIFVSNNQEVEKDAVIGLMGATGRAFGDHLHFEVHDIEGRIINPLSILPTSN